MTDTIRVWCSNCRQCTEQEIVYAKNNQWKLTCKQCGQSDVRTQG